LELGHVPAGWKLTGAWAKPGEARPIDCSILNLWYRDPDAGFEDSDDLATLLGSLQPFDPAAEPEPLATIPSD
jgi:hypothetical protein